MASIKKASNHKWQVIFKKDGSSRKRQFVNIEDACRQLYISEVDLMYVSNELIRDKMKAFKLSKLIDFYLGCQVDKYNRNVITMTTVNRARTIASSIASELMDEPINEISPKQINDNFTEHEMEFLRHAYNVAIENNLCHFNPCKFKKRKPSAVFIPRVREVEALIQRAQPREKMYLFLASGLGLRRSEILALKFIDVGDGEIKVNKRLTRYGIEEGLKTGKERTIPIEGDVVDFILNSRASSEYVISNVMNDNHVSVDTYISHVLKPLFCDANFNYRPHALRHYAVSRMLSKGRSLKEVQLIVGHKDPVSTLGTYAHLTGDEKPLGLNV